MREAVIVIGCSYGDEGKGLAAAWAARRMAGPVLNVLINGGAQRGHTVDLPDGRRHVFHHFGAASLQGAVSCADSDFLVNPLLYTQERAELERDFGCVPKLLISEMCRVSTPWDMMLGQIIEENRGRNRHGSCGCGIHETIVRYRRAGWARRWGALRRLSRREWQAYCRRITEEYLPRRLEEMGMAMGKDWEEAVHAPETAEAAWLDLQEAAEETGSFRTWEEAAAGFPSLVFEAGQGLALDAENREDFPHLTPSRTTSLASARRIAALPGETRTEVLYVTRSYLTRHGAGPFPTECRREEIAPGLLDRTNMPNPHQETLRYGRFDGEAVLRRVRADLAETRKVLSGAEMAVMVTHLNETGGELKGDMRLGLFAAQFDRAYFSFDPARAEGPEMHEKHGLYKN